MKHDLSMTFFVSTLLAGRQTASLQNVSSFFLQIYCTAFNSCLCFSFSGRAYSVFPFQESHHQHSCRHPARVYHDIPQLTGTSRHEMLMDLICHCIKSADAPGYDKGNLRCSSIDPSDPHDIPHVYEQAGAKHRIFGKMRRLPHQHFRKMRIQRQQPRKEL